MGHLSAQGALQIQTLSLDELVSSGGAPLPDHIKIDVEGAEMLVLRGAERLLRECHPTLYLATDLEDLHQDCCRFLAALAYDLQPIDGGSLDQSYEILACRKTCGVAGDIP